MVPLPASYPAAPLLGSMRLHLVPTPQPVAYTTTACWEHYVLGDHRQTVTTRHLTLAIRPLTEGHYELDLAADPPALTTGSALQPVEELALRLAPLYARLLVQAAPTGQLLAVRNQAQLVDTWHTLKQTLVESAAAADQLTPQFIAFVDQQLATPAPLLRSLHYDYLYQGLISPFYHQPLTGPRTREFAQFLPGLSLWFDEAVVPLPAPAPAPDELALRLEGRLDAARTNVAVLGRRLAAEVTAGGGAAPAGTPRASYEATYALDQATGLPQRVELSVDLRWGEVYNRHYTLTIDRV